MDIAWLGPRPADPIYAAPLILTTDFGQTVYLPPSTLAHVRLRADGWPDRRFRDAAALLEDMQNTADEMREIWLNG